MQTIISVDIVAGARLWTQATPESHTLSEKLKPSATMRLLLVLVSSCVLYLVGAETIAEQADFQECLDDPDACTSM